MFNYTGEILERNRSYELVKGDKCIITRDAYDMPAGTVCDIVAHRRGTNDIVVRMPFISPGWGWPNKQLGDGYHYLWMTNMDMIRIWHAPCPIEIDLRDHGRDLGLQPGDMVSRDKNVIARKVLEEVGV